MLHAGKAARGRIFVFSFISTLLHYSGTGLLVLLLAAVLPAYAAAVGSTAGEFSVSDTGQAQYHIPLVIPPGINGMEPSLSFNYSSGGGNGLLGVGWQLSGLPVIHRCDQTLAQNGEIHGVDYSTADRLCLNGNQLRAVSGSYWASGAEYRTEREIFARITQHSSGASAWFEVEYKNGKTAQFGHSADSAINAASGSGITGIRLWAINKLSDRNNNAVVYHYTESAAHGSYRPAYIEYTIHNDTGAFYKIAFNYDTARPDPVIAYHAGAERSQYARLKNVTITAVPGGEPVRRYAAAYTTDALTGKSQLVSITECAGAGFSTCFKPVTFDGQAANSGWAGVSDVSDNTEKPFSGVLFDKALTADLNHDGIADLVYAYDASSTDDTPAEVVVRFGSRSGGFSSSVHTGLYNLPPNNQPRNRQWYVVHPDQDGAPALLSHTTGDDGTNTGVLYRYQNGQFTQESIAMPSQIGWGGAGADFRFGDLNNDQRDDILYIVDGVSGDNALGILWRQANGWVQGPIIDLPFFVSHAEWPNVPAFDYAGTLQIIDMNKDGRAEILLRGAKVWQVCDEICLYHSSTGAYQLQDTPSGWHIQPIHGLTENSVLADVNGDGYPDLAGVYSVWLNNGQYPAISVPTNAPAYSRPIAADLDGDGASELIYSNESLPEADPNIPPDDVDIYTDSDSDSYAMVRFTGGGFSQPVTIWANAPNIWPDAPENGALQAADFNGDGLDDLWTDALDVRMNAGQRQIALTSLTNSFGTQWQIAYSLLTDSAVYTPGTGDLAHPRQHYAGARQVVEHYSVDDGIGGRYTVNYAYAGAKVNVAGRGFLGFAARTVTDSRLGAVVETQFDQSWPYIGLPAQKDLRDAQGDLISRTTISPAQVTWDSGNTQRVFVYPKTTTEQSYRLDTGALLKTVTTAISNVDAYGNPGDTTVTTTGGGKTFITSKTQTYVNNTSSWCLGLVTDSSVTQQLPNGASMTRQTRANYDQTACRANSQKVVALDSLYGDLSLTTAYSYDEWGNITTTTVSAPELVERSSHTSYAGYQGRFPASATNAAGHITTFIWDETLGLQTSVTGPNGGPPATTTYDAFGRPATQAAPDGTTATFSYAWCGLDDCGVVGGVYQLTQSSETGAQNVTVFDTFGRELMTGAPLLAGAWRYHFTRYDALGRVVRQSQPFTTGGELGGSSAMPEPPSFAPTPDDADTKSPDGRYWTLYEYDLLGRVVTVQHPYNPGTGNGGGQTTTQYNGFVTTVTDPNGHSSSKTVNAIGQTVAMLDAAGNTTTYKYDAAGNLIKTTDPVGNIITMGYDVRGNKRVMDDPDMGHWTYTYNAYGELTAQTDAKGQITQLDYDALGRLISRTDGVGSANELTATWVYDTAAYGIGKLASVSQSDGYAEHYTYDNLSRVTDVMTTVGDTDYTVSTTYDQYSRVKTVTYPASVATSNSPVNAIARVLPNTTVTTGEAVTLDGSLSSDNDVDNGLQSLSYQWTQTAGPAVTLSGAASVQAGFTPAQAGVYAFSLTVSDGVDTATDTVSVAVIPPMPGSLTVSDGAISPDGAYTLNWTAPVGGLPAGGAYWLEEDGDQHFGSPTPLTPEGTTATHYPISGKENGTWNYRATLCVAGQCSDPRNASVLVQRPPSAPGTPYFDSNPSPDGDYTVSWTSPGSGQYTGYILHESPGSNSWSLNPGVDSKAFANQPDEHTYTYRVDACNGASCISSDAASVKIISKPGVPSSLTVPATAAGSVALSWGTASGVVSDYQLHESTSSNFSSITRTWTQSDPNDRTRTITVNGNDTFYYRVRAVHEYAGVKQYGAWRNGNRGVRNYEPPGVPASLAASFVQSGFKYAMTVSWGAASSGTVDHYQLQMNYTLNGANSGDWTGWQPLTTTSARSYSYQHTAYADTLLRYRVRACNPAGCSGWRYSAFLTLHYEPDCVIICPPGSLSGGLQSKADTRGVILAPDTATGTGPALKRLAQAAAKGGSAHATAQPVAYTPAAARHAAYASLRTPSPLAGEGWGEGARATAQPVAYTPRADTATRQQTGGYRLMPPGRPADLAHDTSKPSPLRQAEGGAGGGWSARTARPEGFASRPVANRSILTRTSTASADKPFLTPSPLAGEGWGEGAIAATQSGAFTPLYASAFAPASASRKSWWGALTAAFEKDSGDGYRFTVEYTYDAYGHLSQVRNAQDQNLVYWQATESDAAGHITQQTLGNGLITQQTFDPATGQIQAISTGTAGNPVSIQHLAYQWDPVGNLTQRQDLNRALTESFTYDDLNRITQTTVNSWETQSLSYDAIGNIQQKTVSGVPTTYVYDLAGAIGPHAVTRTETASGVITASYQYDANGNLTNGGGRTVTWNAANYPVAISQGSHTTAFTYGPNRQRVTQTEYQSGSLIQTTVSIGALFEQTTDSSGTIRYQHYIRAGSQTVAIHTRTSAYTQTTTYLHRDHLGSVSAMTNEDGDVIAEMSFSAFGERRDPTDWQGSAANPAPDATDRGYTGHKMLDDVGLIHMNGRVYDPGIGRFLSADPIIQAPYNSQSYNRYSYVWNNPLSNTDPSGFIRMKHDAIMLMNMGSPWFNTTSYCAYGEGNCTENMDRYRKGLPFLPHGGRRPDLSTLLRLGLNPEQLASLSEVEQQIYLDAVIKQAGLLKIDPLTAYAELDPNDPSYRTAIVANGKLYHPRYHATCATAWCAAMGANLDQSDPETEAWIKADAIETGKDIISLSANILTIIILKNPVSRIGVSAAVTQDAATIAKFILTNDVRYLMPMITQRATSAYLGGAGLDAIHAARAGTVAGALHDSIIYEEAP